MFDRLNSNCVPKIYFLKTIVLFEWVASDSLTSTTLTSTPLASAPLTSTPLSQRAGLIACGDGLFTN